MSATPDRLLVVLAVLALAGGFGACGSGSSESAGGDDAAQATDTNGAAGETDSTDTGTEDDGGQGAGSEEELVAEEPTANNEVLLGAAFFGEQPADFGALELGASRTISFTLNAVGAARTVTGTSVVGAAAADFALDPGSCASGAVVGEGQSCTARITFRPSAAGARTAGLRVEIDPGVAGGRSLKGNGGQEPVAPPEDTNTDAAPDSAQPDAATDGAQPGTDDAGGATAAPEPEADGG